MVRLGEDRGREHFARRDRGQPPRPLCVGAAPEDELGRDLRARPEAAHGDVAAAQLLGDDAHLHLAEPQAAVRLGDREAEHAELADARNELHRNEHVAPVDVLRDGRDLRVRESPELAAHLVHGLVADARVAETAIARRVCQRDERVAASVLACEAHNRGVEQRVLEVRAVEAEVSRPHVLARSEVDAARERAGDLGDVRARNRGLVLARHALGPARELTAGLELRREVREAVACELMALEEHCVGPVTVEHPAPHRGESALVEPLDGIDRPLHHDRTCSTCRGIRRPRRSRGLSARGSRRAR